ncbi:DUF397 domain-containing protein [Streptomyces boncukensis]|uniref:DUF397 domain-containing protein n=1 Tax=Streptomyces boncukensis TaxID=2711219 RepID=A0A6G4WW92_9ACTN|nr:DUF397 domain-containing protein [Streptomyces boncukensis]NGO69122.1 DUF397 domain-containing protein [Streptomyces boncukensis]
MNERGHVPAPAWCTSTYSGGQGECIEVALTWRTSTYSGAQGDCVQLATNQPDIPVRDTKHQGTGPVIRFPRESWAAFVASLR